MKYIIFPLLIGLSLSISRVSVHDPSIVEDSGHYYVFGSHIATAKSDDFSPSGQPRRKARFH